MSLFDCLQTALDADEVKAERAKRAQAMFVERRDRYRRAGMTDEIADARAAEDVKAAFTKEAGDVRHAFLAQMAVLRKVEARVDGATDLGRLATDTLEYMANSPNAASSLVGQANGLRRLFHKRLEALVTRHSRDLLGRNKDKAGLLNVARELHGQRTGDKAAEAIAKAVSEAFREMRRMFNEAGGRIGELADWGLPHTHDPLAIAKAGFEAWYDDVKGRIAWHRIEDNLTGRPFAAEGAQPPEDTMREFLRSAFDSIVFGRGSNLPTYGKPKGQNIIAQHAESRVLHFRTADDWIAYNTRFGSGDVYGSIIAHAHRMAEDIVTLRELGRSPELTIDYMTDLAVKKARDAGDIDLADRVRGNGEHAKRMLTIHRGGAQPETRRQAEWARFFSSARSVISSALLDKAIVSSLSDSNSMRMAARSVGMNSFSPIRQHMRLLFSGAAREDLLRAGWIADTLTDPGLILSRWQAEVPPAAIAERLSSGVMRAQGLAHWTDQARIAFQAEMAGLFAKNGDRAVADVDEPLRSLLLAKGITDEEWAAFTRAEHLFTAGNGATFASPIWWREHTDLPADRADDLYLRMQALVEEQTEFAVPTQSLWARGFVETRLPPGTIMGEIAKSMLMVKSFMMTYSVNQIARTLAQKGAKARIGYAMNLVAGATVMGSISLQIGNLLMGRDLEEMDPMEDPMFWARAAAKGGGLGVIGDFIAAGETSYGSGFSAFLAGPTPQIMGDVWNLTVGNAIELTAGEETRAGREFVKALDRYTPGGDLPVLGLALDRYLWDSMQEFLDPEASQAMAQAVGRRKRDYRNGFWWLPGTTAPQRAPVMGMQPGPG